MATPSPTNAPTLTLRCSVTFPTSCLTFRRRPRRITVSFRCRRWSSSWSSCQPDSSSRAGLVSFAPRTSAVPRPRTLYAATFRDAFGRVVWRGEGGARRRDLDGPVVLSLVRSSHPPADGRNDDELLQAHPPAGGGSPVSCVFRPRRTDPVGHDSLCLL